MLKILIFGCFFGLMVCTTQGCKSRGKSSKDSVANEIIGENDLISVTNNGEGLPEVYKPLINAIGKMEIPNGRDTCTATHVGQGMVITAGHCIDRFIQDMKEPLRDQPCDFKIEWGLRTDAQPFLVSRCTKIIAFKNRTPFVDFSDWAIFKVDNPPNAKIGLDRSGKDPKIGQQVTLFGHPGGRPLEWAQFCKIFDADLDSPISRKMLAHTCDTEGGISGSAILNNQGLILGIHSSARVPGESNMATMIFETEILSLVPETKE